MATAKLAKDGDVKLKISWFLAGKLYALANDNEFPNAWELFEALYSVPGLWEEFGDGTPHSKSMKLQPEKG